jgi:O-antigen ligase
MGNRTANAVVALATLLLGVVAALLHPVGILAACLLALIIAPVRRLMAIWLPLLIVAVNDQRTGMLLGTDVTAAQKLGVLAALAMVGIFYGFRMCQGGLALGAAWIIALFVSFAASTPLPGVTTGQTVQSWIGYVYPIAAMFIAWERVGVTRVAWAVVGLPWVSVGLGYIFQSAGVGTVIRPEYTGVDRLQGAVIPAHMAMLGFVAVVAACWLRAQGARHALLAAVASLGICLASGTRGATAAALIVVSFTLLSGRVGIGRRIGMLVATAGVLALFLPMLIQRSEGATGEVINSSGRFDAWQFWIDRAELAPWFGQGIGASFRLTDFVRPTSVLADFVVPHNMYLQLWLDLGYVGCATVAVGFVIAWRWVRRNAAPGSGPVLAGLLVGVLVYAVVDNVLVTPQLTVPLAVLLGAITSGGDGEVRHGRGPLSRSNRLRGRQVREAGDRSGQARRQGDLSGDAARHRLPRELQRAARVDSE